MPAAPNLVVEDNVPIFVPPEPSVSVSVSSGVVLDAVAKVYTLQFVGFWSGAPHV